MVPQEDGAPGPAARRLRTGEHTMSETKQRKLWANHLKDEAVALEQQQESAGAEHSPMEGPLPYSADDLEVAVRAEHERCAAIAQAWAQEHKLKGAFAAFTDNELRAAALVARAIASDITAQAEPDRHVTPSS